eukprot:3001566-Pyramimonas_sp.AAC.1
MGRAKGELVETLPEGDIKNAINEHRGQHITQCPGMGGSARCLVNTRAIAAMKDLLRFTRKRAYPSDGSTTP